MTPRFYAINKSDIGRIEKLNKLTDINTFWEDVRKMTKHVTSCRVGGKWQVFAERRYDELLTGHEDIYTEIEYGKPTRYFKKSDDTEVFPIQ